MKRPPLGSVAAQQLVTLYEVPSSGSIASPARSAPINQAPESKRRIDRGFLRLLGFG
jgi:hypothetical protein